jgi:UDP-glucose 4-epimerase
MRAVKGGAMRVLVTGGTGFIGSNVVRTLAERGDEVIVPFRSAPDEAVLNFLADVKERVVLVPGDVERVERMSFLTREHQVEAIIHGAAVTPLPETELAMPRRVLQINFMGTVHILEAARANDVKRVVYVSSGALYGPTGPGQPVTEDTAPDPRNLYGIAKGEPNRIPRATLS